MSNGINRRFDIDLLRALAVMAVMLFHFDVPGFSGGFLGVDVFFVISGYLITKHLQEQIQAGTFTFVYFYARRIRRLMPALFVTLLFTSIVALAIFPKQMLSDFSESMFASSIYLSNAYFWSQTGYFDTASHLKPLLHTWSLSVEEQFYLFWPLFILVVVSLGKSRLVIFVVGLLSLVAAELLYDKGTSLTFFMFPFRIFEFAIGAFIFKSQLNKNKQSYSFLLSLLGWLFVIGSLFLLDDKDKMPGLLSLPICLGTALIIYANYQFNGRNLLIKLGIRIGLISYSAYLIHWPLVVFYKFSISEHLDAIAIIVLVMSTLILAEFMYRYVEQATAKFSLQKPLFSYSWVLGIGLFSGTYLLASPHLYSLVQFNNESVQELIDNTETYKVTNKITGKLSASYSNRISNTKILILGDSHSRSALSAIAPFTRAKIDVLNNICDPLTAESLKFENLEHHYSNHGNAYINIEKCEAYHQTLLSEIVKYKPNLVIFSEQWRKEAMPFLAATVESIKAKTNADILLFGPNFELRSEPRIIFKKVKGITAINAFAKKKMIDLSELERDVLLVAKQADVYFISKIDIVCPNAECIMHKNNKLTYADSNHWGLLGLKIYGESITNLAPFNNNVGKLYESYYLDNANEYQVALTDYSKFSPNDFNNLREFYLHAKAANQQFSDGLPGYLVLGDGSRLEVFSALSIKYKYKGVNDAPYMQPCAPLILKNQTGLLKELYKRKPNKYDQCENYHEKLMETIMKAKPKRLYFAYNWQVQQLPFLEDTIKKIKTTLDADIFLVALKPRIIEGDKNQFLGKVNQKLKRIAQKMNVNYIDTRKAICEDKLNQQCLNIAKDLYKTPNSLNIKGLMQLSSQLELATHSYVGTH